MDVLQQNSPRPQAIDGIIVQNDPVNRIDPWGLLPGQEYLTAEEAGFNAVNDVLNKSRKEGREYCGNVYKTPNDRFSYTEACPGSKARCVCTECEQTTIPEGTSRAATGYHTHGRNDPGYDNEEFSDWEKDVSDVFGRPVFVGTPSGKIKMYHQGAVTPLN
jgi:hypothetical protein